MPLEQRVIQPIYVSRGCFNLQGQPQSANQTLNIPNELECVTNGTLGNIIRQLSSLSKHAENLFSCLLEDLGSMLHRSVNLSQRIETLTHHVEHLDASNDSTSHYNNDPYNRQHGSSRNMANKSSTMMVSHQKAAGGVEQFDQQVVARATIPDSLREVYETCDPPPSLEKLNPFRDDQMNGLKLYTNPNYFFELWRKEMLQDKSTKTKVAKNKQGDNIHSSGGSSGKSKRNRQQQKQQLVHQSSSETNNSYSQQLPAPPPMNQYHPQQISSQPPHHYQAGGYYQTQQQQQQQPGQMEILTQKINPMGTTPGYTVIEGPISGPYQPPQSERPNSLELHQQQNYIYNNNHQQPQTGGINNYAPGMNMVGQNNPRTQPQQSHYGSMAPYQNQSPQQQQQQHQQNTPPQQYSPSATTTPTKRQSSAQVSRPSAPPPAPPGGNTNSSSNNNSQPNSQPGTPMHKKITMVNGQEVEMRDQAGGAQLNRMVSRDSLPPPPPPPPNAQLPNGTVGGNMNMIANSQDLDCHDSALPPPPPPPPPTFIGNGGNQNSNNFTSPPPPPPPPNNGQIPSNNNNNNSNNAQYKTKAAKPTAQELQSVVLKKIDPNSHHNNHPNNPADDVRSNLLAAIRHGITLKRVEEETRKRDENEQKLKYHDVASILARRVAMEISDSDGENEHGEHDGDSDAWDDESEC